MDAAREALGAFVGADPDDLAFVPNATAGFNTVLRSLRFAPGDELLTTDHAYNAAKNAMEFVAAAREERAVVIAGVPFPSNGPAAVVEAVLAAVTPRTRLAVLDHITSATAVIFPIEDAGGRARRARRRHAGGRGARAGAGRARRDGARARPTTPPTCTSGCAPRRAPASSGCGATDRRGIRPLAISHGANSPRTDRTRFRLEFDWTGTADQSAYLAVPDAIRFGAELLPGGWAAHARAEPRAGARGARTSSASASTSRRRRRTTMIGCMASVPLPLETEPGRVQGIELYDDPVHVDADAS